MTNRRMTFLTRMVFLVLGTALLAFEDLFIRTPILPLNGVSGADVAVVDEDAPALNSAGNEIVTGTDEETDEESGGGSLRGDGTSKKRIGRFRRKDDLSAILFPGVVPENYEYGEDITMWTDLVTSSKTQVPFKYYNLPVCTTDDVASSDDKGAAATTTKGKKKKPRKNLGQKLQGYQKAEALYQVEANVNKHCTVLCSKELSEKDLIWLRKLVDRHYRVHMTLDGLPVLMRSSELTYAVRGYPVGFKAPPSYTGYQHDEYFLYNHIKFIVRYTEDTTGAGTGDGNSGGDDNNNNNSNLVNIVGFDAHPVSITHNDNTCGGGADQASPTNKLKTFLAIRGSPDPSDSKKELPLMVTYSYEVVWEPSHVAWADRWDIYMVGSPDDEVHLFSILNSLMVVTLLTGAVATIMIRTLKRDIATYNEMHALGASDGMEEEGGWKLMHGDVFRPPPAHRLLLSVAVGTGAQITIAFMLTMLCSLFGVLSTVNKGQLLTHVIMLYVLSGSVAGYVSARLQKFFGSTSWKQTMIMTATAFPAVLVTLFLALDIMLSFQGAATAVSIWTILSLFLLWIFVSTPLVLVGSFFGFRADKIKVPTRTNQIARVIPEGAWYFAPPYSYLIGGLLPFGNVCIEVYFIMGALWLHQIYYVMGFLFSVMIVLILTSAEIAIVMCYLQLAGEDHQWWWRSFLNVASSGFYMLLYSLWYLAMKLDLVGMLPKIVYLTYMSMISMALALCCGAVGTLSCFWFTKTIYKALKVD